MVTTCGLEGFRAQNNTPMLDPTSNILARREPMRVCNVFETWGDHWDRNHHQNVQKPVSVCIALPIFDMYFELYLVNKFGLEKPAEKLYICNCKGSTSQVVKIRKKQIKDGSVHGKYTNSGS